ncbi:MAG: vWA domain-containing protein, partial [Limisphaerales bacterium]
LVLFATQAYIGTPLTLDHDFLIEDLNRLGIGAINPNATAIGDGLTTALNQLRRVQAKSKIVILMTDGQNNSGNIDPLTAAQAAQALGVKVYTIGVSKNGMAPMPVGKNPFTGETIYQNEPVDVDETTLKQIAQITNGQYYRADTAERFQQIYAEINKLEKTEQVINKFTEYRELFPWFVACGLVLLIMEITLGQTVFRKLP